MAFGIDDVHPDMSLEYLGHQAIQGAPTGGDRLQDLRAVERPIERLLDRAELTLNAFHPRDQLLLVLDQVGHRLTIPQYPSLKEGGQRAGDWTVWLRVRIMVA